LEIKIISCESGKTTGNGNIQFLPTAGSFWMTILRKNLFHIPR